MARPARRVEEPQIEGHDDANTQVLDEASQEGQSLRTGQVAQGDEFIQTLARKAGWTPKEEWKRDPTRWVDERTYLEHLPDELDSLKERNKRTAQAAADAIEDSRRQARIEAQAAVRAAAETQDPDAAEAAAKQLAKVSGPHPQTVAWMGRNPWFQDDPDATALAVNEIQRLAGQGASVDDQLQAAEAKIRKRFPEHFGQAERTESREEVPLSESRHNRTPPAVQAGTRGGEIRTKEKGFTDIPPGDRALYQRHFAKRFEQTMKPEDAQKKYAASYWANKGEA